jgi:hypothetical protein
LQQVDFAQPLLFKGVHLSGNPTRRPVGTASKCENLRVMPGNWIRLRGGRRARTNTVGGIVTQIHPFRDPNFLGSSSHMAQVRYAGAGTARWTWFDLATYTIDPFGVFNIDLTFDGAWSLNNPAAIANIADRPVFYNGLGVRNGTNSRPALSSYYAGIVRYFGLDAYCPGLLPTVGFAAGAGANTVLTSVSISVGLYHEPTGHYSNAVAAGSIATTGASGTITVSNLDRLVPAFNNATEQAELFYVFYATIDGLQTRYLILNSALNGPHKVAISATSASLSVAGGTTNGWVLDTTSEAPIDNFPPRPMKCLVSANQRLYAIPLDGGSGSGSDFSYVYGPRELGSIKWSKSSGDSTATKAVGDPLQSWPLENQLETPTMEYPLWAAPSLSEIDVIVWTAKSTLLLSELTNGVHRWEKLSGIHGISNPMTVRLTEYGLMWLNQRNQICLLESDTKDGLKVVSGDYQGLLRGKTPVCADYLLNPLHEIDRYQVWFSDGTSLCHDFAIRDSEHPLGHAYTCTSQDFTAAATLIAQNGSIHHCVAKGGFYTHESQPEDNLIPTTDQTFTDTTTQATTTTQINGEYVFNWNCQGDPTKRKQVRVVDFIGDGASSTALGARPIALRLWKDFQPIADAPLQYTAIDGPQQETGKTFSYRVPIEKSWASVFKVGFTVSGHSSDHVTFDKHQPVEQQGDLARNFYGSVMEAAVLIGNPDNVR